MLRIHENAVRLVAECVGAAKEIERHDPDLARQLRRAIVSVPLNIAEGSDQSGKRRTQHYRTALGSAREAWSALVVAHAAGYTRTAAAGVSGADFRAVIGTLTNCVRRG